MKVCQYDQYHCERLDDHGRGSLAAEEHVQTPDLSG